MTELLWWLQLVAAIPIVGGTVYGIGRVAAVLLFRRRRGRSPPAIVSAWSPVSVLKPIFGIDKNLAANLRSICTQDYPTYQVVLSVQRLDEPALPLLQEMLEEFGSERVSVVAVDNEPVVNGKVQNLLNALGAARHDIVVISDSDVFAPPDYLKAIVAPLHQPDVGCACTLYRAVGADRWFERLELLTLNADFTLDLIFARMTGVSDFCLGASTAVRRSTLDAIGGLESLSDYLVEDYEMGRRIRAKGLRISIVPYFVDLVVDRSSASEWWRHQLYWDQHTHAARPIGFIATVLTHAVPFALVFAAARLFDPLGLWVLGGVLAVRVGTAALALHLGLSDREGLRGLAWLPVRDIAGLASWFLALRKRTFVWRGLTFRLTGDGRILPGQVGGGRR